MKKLEFKHTQKNQDVLQVYNFNLGVFNDVADVKWTVEDIKHELKNGWEMYSIVLDGEIIAALFAKIDEKAGTLYTKHTPIKLEHRGNGYSHQIKDFFETLAKNKKLNRVVNVTRSDNFRMTSLNETHGYRQTGRLLDDKNLIEWEKILN